MFVSWKLVVLLLLVNERKLQNTNFPSGKNDYDLHSTGKSVIFALRQYSEENAE